MGNLEGRWAVYLEWTGNPDDVLDAEACLRTAHKAGRHLTRGEESLALYIVSRNAALGLYGCKRTLKERRDMWKAAGNGSNPDVGVGNRRKVLRGFKIRDDAPV